MSSSCTTTPYSDGSSTSLTAIVATPPDALWAARNAVRSMSVRPSPLMTRNVDPDEELAERVGAAGRAEEVLLEVVLQLDAELGAVAEVRADLLRVVVQVGGDLGDAVAPQQAQQMLHDRAG